MTPQERLEKLKMLKNPELARQDALSKALSNVLEQTEKIKGKDGYTPVKGVDYFTEPEIQEFATAIKSQVKDGVTPKKGIDYEDGKDGHTPIKGVDYFDGKNGKTPVLGTDYFTPEDKSSIVSDVLKKVPKPNIPVPKVDDIVSKAVTVIKSDTGTFAAKKEFSDLVDFLKRGGFRGGSGGSSVTLKTNGTPNGSQSLLNLVAGSNITLTDNGSGSVTIASSGSGSGTVTSFAFTNGAGFTGTVTNATTTPTLSLVLQNATTSQSGQLTSTDWNTFNNKGSGTVTAIGVTTANGVSGTSSGGAAPNLTITLGAITPSTVNGVTLSGTSTPTLAVTGTSAISGTNTGDNSANSTYASDYRSSNFIAGTNYQAPITLTTTGTSGAATFSGGTLNIPQYAGTTYTGTTNRITVTGSVIDISASYVGQSSITTLGTITTGVWNGTVITGTYLNIGSLISAGTNITITGSGTIGSPYVINSSGGASGVSSVASADGSITVTNPTTTVDLAVVKAPKWSTARNLAGNSVDGSANVAFANKFIVQGTTDAGLSNAQFLGALSTGIVKNTTTTGVLSIAVAGDFPTLNQNTTGSAATLTTPRAINGVNFDGSAAITVTAAAGTLTGTTLNSTVVSSSLTSLGTITTGVWQGTAITGTYIASSVALAGSPTTTTQASSDNSTKIATTAYVTTAITNALNGLDWKPAVQWATTANVIGTNVAGVFTYTSTGVDTIDGRTLALNDVILFKNQTTAADNGVWVVTTAGALGIAGVLTRRSDYNTAAEIQPGDAFYVLNGTVNANTTWVQTNTVTTINSDPLAFSQAAGPGTYLAGTGLTLTGSTFSVNTSQNIATLSNLTSNGIVTTSGGGGSLSITATTGSGNVVLASSPTLVTPTLGAATATSINGLAITNSTGTLTIANAKTATINNTLTFTGTDGSSVAFGTGGTVLYANQTITLSGDVTGSGSTSITTTLATVNTNTGSFGSSTAIPTFTVNGKGLITAASTVVIVAPAGTLSGTVLNSTVVTSSLTAVGTITTGIWTGTTIASAHGGTGVNNGTSTITIGGNFAISGAFTFTGTVTANTAVTFPTSGTLVNTAVTTLSSLVSVGTITTGGLGTGAVIGGVTMTLGSDASYDMYYRNASGVLTRIPNGTTGQVLTATTSAAPGFASPAAPSAPIVSVQSTVFESSGRFSITGGGTTAFSDYGLLYSPGSSYFIRTFMPITYAGATSDAFSGNPTFSMTVFLQALNASGGSSDQFFGIGGPTITSSSITFTAKHIGFKLEVTGGTAKLYGTQADGTTENATSSLVTLSDGDTLDVYVSVISGTSATYYYNRNGTGWSSGTTLTTNLPTSTTSVSGVTDCISLLSCDKNSGNGAILRFLGASYSR